MSKIDFDPIGAEAQYRRDNPTYDEARKRQEEEAERYLAPVVNYFARLEEEVTNMPIAQRFRRDRKPDLTLVVGGTSQFLPSVLELNEAEFKRSQLMSDLLAAKGRAVSLIGIIEGIVIDIEATKRD